MNQAGCCAILLVLCVVFATLQRTFAVNLTKYSEAGALRNICTESVAEAL